MRTVLSVRSVVGLLCVVGWAVGVSDSAFASVPELSSCGSHLPPIEAPSWRAAQRQLVAAGAVAARLCLGESNGDVSSVRFLNLTTIRALGGEFDAIPASAAAGGSTCSRAMGPRVVATFAYASGQTVSVSTDLGSCAVVTNGSVSRRAVGQHSHSIFDLELLTGSAPPLQPRLIGSRGAPGCSVSTSQQPERSGVQSATVSVPGSPFGVVASRDGRWSFVAITGVPSSVPALGQRTSESQIIRRVGCRTGVFKGFL
jgi:hypothetical protein